MNSHLVAVEVSVERCTNQWVKLDSSALYKDRLECLNTKSVKCRRTVEHYRVTLNNVFKCVPNLWLSSVYLFPCRLDVDSRIGVNKSFHNERLEQLESHFLWQTALIHLKLRAYDDNRTS